MGSSYPANQEISDVLERVAALLEAQNANPYAREGDQGFRGCNSEPIHQATRQKAPPY